MFRIDVVIIPRQRQLARDPSLLKTPKAKEILEFLQHSEFSGSIFKNKSHLQIDPVFSNPPVFDHAFLIGDPDTLNIFQCFHGT